MNLLLDHVFSLSKLWINFVYSLSTFFWAINLTNLLYYPFRSSHRRCFVRKSVLRNFEKFTRKHLCKSLFFNKKKTLWKKRSDTDVFLWTLRNIKEHLFYSSPPGDCFCSFSSAISIVDFALKLTWNPTKKAPIFQALKWTN